MVEWGCVWGSCLQIHLLLLECNTVLDQASGEQQEVVPKCERSYLHVFTRTGSSWESLALWFYHEHADWVLFPKNPLAPLQRGICLQIPQCTGKETSLFPCEYPICLASPSTDSWGFCMAMTCHHTWVRESRAATCCSPLSVGYLWSSISVTTEQLSLLVFRFLGQSQPPVSFSWCPVVQSLLERGVQVSYTLKQSWSVLEEALPAHPTICLSHGGMCCVR